MTKNIFTSTIRAKRVTLSLAMAAAALLLSSAVAVAEIRVGTDGPETLTGTNAGDLLNGKGGNDTLKGLAANDTYHFANSFGDDTLEELATYKVGKKRLPGGTDTLSFARYTADVDVRLVPDWANLNYNRVIADQGVNSVTLGISRVENVVGGLSDDRLEGGAARNTYSGGPGGDDDMYDWGGWKADGTFSAQVISDDTYKGFASGTGHDRVFDYAGTVDRLDLRPLESSDVYFEAFDHDGNATNGEESLKLIVNEGTTVTVVGHFSPAIGDDMGDGRIEQFVFSDGTITSAAEVRSMMQ
jgi:Haemolysin-type calcium binding protein related domain/RTX calcium-binding nonapeptide repeat (4 copies)